MFLHLLSLCIAVCGTAVPRNEVNFAKTYYCIKKVSCPEDISCNFVFCAIYCFLCHNLTKYGHNSRWMTTNIKFSTIGMKFLCVFVHKSLLFSRKNVFYNVIKSSFNKQISVKKTGCMSLVLYIHNWEMFQTTGK